jgi:hypothetical protein
MPMSSLPALNNAGVTTAPGATSLTLSRASGGKRKINPESREVTRKETAQSHAWRAGAGSGRRSDK